MKSSRFTPDSGLKHVRQLASAALVIGLTAFGTVQEAVETMKLGAYDFMIKSTDLNGIDAVIARALDVLRLRQWLESELGRQDSQCHMKNLEARSPAMKQLFEQVREVAEIPRSSMMLLGETGTEKEFLAHVIHHNGPRRLGRLLVSTALRFPKNCSALSKEPLPAPFNVRSACLKKRRAAPSFLMRSAIWISRCRQNCLVRFRSVRSGDSVPPIVVAYIFI